MNGLSMDERTYNRFSAGIDNSIQRLNAILSLLEPLRSNGLDLTCAAQLGSVEFGGKCPQEQQAAAYTWMANHYERVSAAVFATIVMCMDSMNDLEDLSMKLYPIGQEIKGKRLERMKGGLHYE